MLFDSNSDLPVSFPLKFSNVNTALNPSPTVSFLSSMSMGGVNNGGTGHSQSGQTVTSVTQALEVARDSPEGAQDPTVVSILEGAVANIWRKIEAQPTSYVMTRDEFAVFNYFQGRFAGQQLATDARKRYWDHIHLSNGN